MKVGAAAVKRIKSDPRGQKQAKERLLKKTEEEEKSGVGQACKNGREKQNKKRREKLEGYKDIVVLLCSLFLVYEYA